MIRSLVNAVVVCLRESHRCRATFRKCGGFNSLLSIILSLDQCLSFKHSDQNSDSKDVNDDKEFNLSSILLLLRSVFNCLAVAMRFEPANAKFFQVSWNFFLVRTHACISHARVCVCVVCTTCFKVKGGPSMMWFFWHLPSSRCWFWHLQAGYLRNNRSGNVKFWPSQPGACASKNKSLTILSVGFARKRTRANTHVQTHTCKRTSHVCTHKVATYSLNLHFQQEVASGDSLLNAIQLIGCFSTCTNHAYVEANMIQPPAQGNLLKGIDNKNVGR